MQYMSMAKYFICTDGGRTALRASRAGKGACLPGSNSYTVNESVKGRVKGQCDPAPRGSNKEASQQTTARSSK